MDPRRPVPYPTSIFEEVQSGCKLAYSESDGYFEYTEIIRSRQKSDPEPRSEPKPEPRTKPASTVARARPSPPILETQSVLRRSLGRLDALLDRAQLPLLVQYRTAVKIAIVLVLTWQLAQLADQLAFLIRSYCGL